MDAYIQIGKKPNKTRQLHMLRKSLLQEKLEETNVVIDNRSNRGNRGNRGNRSNRNV